jgi:hypothetical protein
MHSSAIRNDSFNAAELNWLPNALAAELNIRA